MLTQEQQAVVDTVCSSVARDKIIAVNSIAGSGKTSTGDAVIRAYKPKNGFYTAFNRAIVRDSSRRFGDLLDCRTVHSLAYQYVKPGKKIEEFNYMTIKEDLDYQDKTTIIDTLDDFFRSSSTNIEEYVTQQIKDEYLQDLIVTYANKMLNGEIPPTFNYMLKCLHLMLLNKQIEINYDLMILDECQDTTAVTLEIFKLIQAKAKVIFGDKFQNIYSFMKTVNAFDELDDVYLLRLTKSFRCNPDIAQLVENFGKEFLEEDFQYKGNEDILPKETYEEAYISRTNATLIYRMKKLLDHNRTFSLTRDAKEIFALPIALLNASIGRKVYDSRYKYLEKEYGKYLNFKELFGNVYKNYFEYLCHTVDNPVIIYTCSMLTQFNKQGISIYDVKNIVSAMKPNKQTILTTAHAFKGLECDNVFIEDDLNRSVKGATQTVKDFQTTLNNDNPISLTETRKYLSTDTVENLNTYYVALSRAKTSINNVDYH